MPQKEVHHYGAEPNLLTFDYAVQDLASVGMLVPAFPQRGRLVSIPEPCLATSSISESNLLMMGRPSPELNFDI